MRLAAPLTAAAAAGLLAAVGEAAASPAAPPTLVGTVGPGFTITLMQSGKKVSKLKAGTYTLTIRDAAAIHAWSLDGPNGYAKDFTTVPFTGTKTFTVTLVKGAYKFYCPPHESGMFGRFTVS
jgi:plastocyanin